MKAYSKNCCNKPFMDCKGRPLGTAIVNMIDSISKKISSHSPSPCCKLIDSIFNKAWHTTLNGRHVERATTG